LRERERQKKTQMIAGSAQTLEIKRFAFYEIELDEPWL